MSSSIRIEICGGIASGKTTLAHALARFKPEALVLEDFRANPFWKRFYEAPAVFAAEKNICFIAQHCGEIRARLQTPLTVCDYAVLQDLAYARLHPDAEHFALMTALYAHLYLRLPPPRLVVRLLIDPTVQLTRIRARGRLEEDQITLDYLVALNAALDNALALRPPSCELIEIRSDSIDFAHDRVVSDRLALDLLTRAG